MRHRRSGRMRGPLAPYAAGFRAELASRGYAPVSVEHRAAQFSQISRWLDAERLEPIDADVIIRRHASARMAAPLGTPGPRDRYDP